MGLSSQRNGLGTRVNFDDRTVANLIIASQGQSDSSPGGWRDPVVWSVAAIARHFRCSSSQVSRNLVKARRYDLRLEIVRVGHPGGVGTLGVYYGANLCELSARRGMDRDDFFAIEAGTGRKILLRCTRRLNPSLGLGGTWAGKFV